jgi:hypothetical protein
MNHASTQYCHENKHPAESFENFPRTNEESATFDLFGCWRPFDREGEEVCKQGITEMPGKTSEEYHCGKDYLTDFGNGAVVGKKDLQKNGIQVKASIKAQKNIFSPSLCLYHANAIGLRTKKMNSVPHSKSHDGK